MANRTDDRTDALGSTFNEATRNFFRMTGGWGNVNGPGFLMLRVVLTGSSSAVVMGLAGSACTAAFFGTAALPFVVFACFGFLFGAVGFYRDAMRQSLTYLERFPRLLQLHLDANFPTRGFLQYRQDQLRAAHFSRSWTLQSMLIASWLTAQPALDVSLRKEYLSSRVLC